jgi:hypothetical protein
MHINSHLTQHALSYANLINISVGVKEMVHRTFKNFAPHTNKKEIDFDLIKRYITMEGIRNFFDNNPEYKKINLFNDWYITSGLTNISKGNNILFKYLILIFLIFNFLIFILLFLL